MNCAATFLKLSTRVKLACWQRRTSSTFEDVLAKYQKKYPDITSLETYLKTHGPEGNVSLGAFDGNSSIDVVTIDHPSKRNALTGNMMVALRHAFQRVHEKPNAKLVLLQGAGGNFCSGGELGFVKAIASEEGAYVMSTYMGGTLREMASSPQVHVAVLEGHTLGGGSELASACDVRIAHVKAKVGFVQGMMGVCPGWGGGAFIVEALGRARAIELLGTARILTAEELYKLGYANFVYSERDELLEWLRRFDNLDVKPLHGAKRVVAGHAAAETAGCRQEQQAFLSLWGGQDHLQALQRTLERLGTKKKE